MNVPAKHAAAIVTLAIALTVPALLSPQMTHDSFWIDWVWADQFTAELAKGNFYPRWLPLSHGGLGSPVFYYYPPLAFYACALFGLAGFSTYWSIIAVFCCGFALAGFTMYAWLRETAKSPLLGVLLFMAMPYHVLDFYGRGALAEFAAIALIPLVALGVKRATEGRYVLGAAAYAAMILTHVPLALLASIFLIAPYAVWLCWKESRKLLRVAIPVTLGILLSAIFLLPAVLLELYRDTANLWRLATFNPENWSLWAWGAPGPNPDMRSAVAAVMLTLIMPIVVLLFTTERVRGAYAAAMLVLAAGLIPGFWTLPVLHTVQFPFRLLPLAEFAIATGVAHLVLQRALIAAAVVPVLVPSALFLAVHPNRPEVTVAELPAHPDVPEMLPPGERPYTWPSRWALELSKQHTGRLFYFPTWEAECAGQKVKTAPEPGTQLLGYKGQDCELRLSTSFAERLGAILSLAGLLILAGIAWAQRRTWMTPTLSE